MILKVITLASSTLFSFCKFVVVVVVVVSFVSSLPVTFDTKIVAYTVTLYLDDLTEKWGTLNSLFSNYCLTESFLLVFLGGFSDLSYYHGDRLP